MKKIFTYSQFINEEMGVSPSFTFSSEITNKVLKRALIQYKKGQTEFDGRLKMDSSDLQGSSKEFPLANIMVGISSSVFTTKDLIDEKDHDLYVEGLYNGGSFAIDEDNLISFEIGVKISVKKEDIKALVNDDKKITELLRREIESTVTHELTHAYEDYMRSLNKNVDLTIHDTKEFLYDMVANNMLREYPFPKTIVNLLYNIYTCASYEVNARVAQSYSLVRNIKDPHKRWDIIKNSSIYKIANNLDMYNAQTEYDELYKSAKSDLKTDAKVLEWMGDFMEVIVNEFLQANNGLSRMAANKVNNVFLTMSSSSDNAKEKVEMEKKVIDIIRGHSIQVKKEMKNKDLLGFMKIWEKKFHKSGQDMKYRLGKITMLNNELSYE